MAKRDPPLTYAEHLQLERLLSCQIRQSELHGRPAHDESPDWQRWHRPQRIDDSTTTRVPIGCPSVPWGSWAMRPTTSWPGTSGYRTNREVPFQAWTSTPEMPVASMASQPPWSTSGTRMLVRVK